MSSFCCENLHLEMVTQYRLSVHTRLPRIQDTTERVGETINVRGSLVGIFYCSDDGGCVVHEDLAQV